MSYSLTLYSTSPAWQAGSPSKNVFLFVWLAVRAKEKRWLQRAAYLQTMSIAFTPLMPVFAAICTFTALILTGGSLTITEVNTITPTCITGALC